MELITVIIPVYNVERYIRQCLDSVINQTYKDLEIILIDDGSEDNSGKICDEYQSRDSRIKVIHKENGGQAEARNIGLDMMQGEYVAFVDSDDFIELDMYENMYLQIKRNNADCVVCGYNKCVEEKIQGYKLKNNVTTGKKILNNYFEDLWEFWYVVWNKLYKKSVFKDNRFYVGKKHEDNFISHRILYASNVVVCMEKIYYNYIVREGSTMGKEYNPQRLDDAEAYLERAVFYNEHNLSEKMVEWNINNYFYFLWISYMRGGMKKEFRKRRKELHDQYKKNILRNKVVKNIYKRYHVRLILDYLLPAIIEKIRRRKHDD